MVRQEGEGGKHQTILKNIMPLAIEVGNMMDDVNKENTDIDEKDLGHNIDNAALGEIYQQSRWIQLKLNKKDIKKNTISRSVSK